MSEVVKIKAIVNFFLRKILGDRNYEKIIQLVRKKIRYLKFIIKGRMLKQSVRILLSRYAGLGDILLTTPVIRAIKTIYPYVQITFDTTQRGKELLEGNPDIDRIAIRSNDLLQSNFDWECYLRYDPFPSLHVVDAYLKYVGIKVKSNEEKIPAIFISDSDKNFAKNFLNSHNLLNHKLLVGVHAQAGYEHRRWPLENFREVLSYLEEKYQAKFVEFGTNGQPIVGKGISLVGKCSIKQSAAVLQNCTLLICNDSLMLHIAGALGVPVVAIFGPSIPETRLPFNNISLGCWPKGGCRGCINNQKCYKGFGITCYKDFPECMYAVKPTEVINTIEKLLRKIWNKKSLLHSRFVIEKQYKKDRVE